jgi:hypothetical protein
MTQHQKIVSTTTQKQLKKLKQTNKSKKKIIKNNENMLNQ